MEEFSLPIPRLSSSRTISALSGIFQTLANLGITDTRGGEFLSLSFGIDEVRDLLKFSITSATPLTDMIFKNTAEKLEPWISLPRIQKDDANSRKMVLKICLPKTTNKFLFAEAMDEFVELLFSFLTVPLGGVEFLFGGYTGFKSIDNLYESVSNGIDDLCFTRPDIKNRLINPKLPHGYISKNQFLSLSEEAPKLCCREKLIDQRRFEYTFHEKVGFLVSDLKSMINKNYFKKQTMFVVTDDLSVSPNLSTNFAILNGLGIPLSDVEETELQIGAEEALRILKACLTSKTVLTDALVKPMMLNKLPKLELQPKQER